MLEYTLEQEFYNKGYNAVCGVDEAGRGPLCGPVVAAAVILPCGLYIEGLNDSKKLTEKKREALYDIIFMEPISLNRNYSEIKNGLLFKMLINKMKIKCRRF